MRIPAFIKLREKFGFQIFATFGILIMFVSFCFIFVLIHFQYTSMLSALENRGRLMAEGLAHQSRLWLYSENTNMLQSLFDESFSFKAVIEATLFDNKRRLVVNKKNSHLVKTVFTGSNFVTIDEVVRQRPELRSTLVFYRKNALTVWSPVFLGTSFVIDDPLFRKDAPKRDHGTPIGYVRITLTKTFLKKELRSTVVNIFGLGLLFLLASAMLSLFLTKQISRPVKQLVEGVKKYGKEGECGTLPLSARNEIGGLAHAFHEMTHTLDKHIQQQIESTKELAHAKKLAELGMASSKVTHEVGNLLNNMELVILTLKSESLSNQGKHHLAILEKDATRVQEFISDFLQFARKPNLQMQTLSLALIIKEVLRNHEAYAAACGITLHLDWPQTIPTVTIDRRMIYHAFANLLKNSFEAIGKNGTIKISGRINQQNLMVAIEDNGPGIEPKAQEELFEPFFTTKGKRGTGLGLAIVQGIMQAHEGMIHLDNTYKKGARFELCFPIGSE